jgi:hypothetical protein
MLKSPVFAGALIYAALASAQVSVTTYHNDNTRSGLNSQETILTPSNVNVTSFGQLFSYPVDGQIYAQPLYMPGVAIAGKGTHNVVYVATEYDSIYAFDADSNTGANASPLWQVAIANPSAGITPLPSSDVSCKNLEPQIGITGTPVIDPSSGTLYAVATTKESPGGTVHYYQRLHALDITSGAEKFGGPFTIAATVPGNCYPNRNGSVVFSALHQNQRAGLLLQNGLVVVVWGSHCDNNPYTGWAIAFQASTGKQLAVFNAAPDMGTEPYECRAGIWQGGAAPSVDSEGSMYLATGNGYFNANNTGGLDFGDSVLRFPLTTSALSVADYFTPYNQATLDEGDKDVGGGGVLVLPDQPGSNPHLAVAAGKEGTIYLLNRDNLGKYNPSGDSQIVQEFPNALGGVWGISAYFNGSVYFGSSHSSLKAYSLSNGLFASTPASQSSNIFDIFGPTPSVSANGTTNGIVWGLDASAWNTGGPVVLHAYDATNLAHELYSTTQNAARDQLGPAVKFTVPTVVNGKLYVGTGNTLAVLGLL